MSKSNLPFSLDAEWDYYNTLYAKGSSMTTTGSLNWTSNTSNTPYTSTTGEQGMFAVLQAALVPHLMTADDANNLFGYAAGNPYSLAKAVDLANCALAVVPTVLLAMYPVGSIKMSVNNLNPSTYIGGTWVLWGSGKVPVGIDTTDTDFNIAEKTTGNKTHTQSFLSPAGYQGDAYTWELRGDVYNQYRVQENIEDDNTIPATVMLNTNAQAQTVTLKTVHMTASNVQPSIVCYMWKRTA